MLTKAAFLNKNNYSKNSNIGQFYLAINAFSGHVLFNSDMIL